MKIPPAPESRRMVVSTVLFPETVLQVTRILRFIDSESSCATSTEEMVSDLYVRMDRLSKNPHLPLFL